MEENYYHLYTCIDHPEQTFRLEDTLVGILRPRCKICNKRMADTGEMVKRGLDSLSFCMDSEKDLEK